MRVRPAQPGDAAAMGRLHVDVWRSTYAGILPDRYLANLSAPRHSTYYEVGILRGNPALVATETVAGTERVVGFATVGLRRNASLGAGEIETLYVGLDHQDQGVGRALMAAAGETLAASGAGSAFLWVLSENPSQWFYRRIGGRRAAHGQTRVAGATVGKTAYVWDPIDLLLNATTSTRSD